MNQKFESKIKTVKVMKEKINIFMIFVVREVFLKINVKLLIS